MVVGCEPLNERNKMLMTVRVTHIPNKNSEVELKGYRVTLTKQTDPTASKVELEPGQYRIYTEAEWCEFSVKVGHKD